MAAHKLDIFETLAAIDKRDRDFYARLPEEMQKGFAPPVVLRWASAVEGPAAEHYIWLVNDRANVNFHDIWEHPELQFKLLASCGYGGRGQRHQWIPMVGKKAKSDQVRTFLSQFWPDANDMELDILFSQFTDETFEDFVMSSGLAPDEAKEIMKAYGRLTGKTAAKPKGKKAKSADA